MPLQASHWQSLVHAFLIVGALTVTMGPARGQVPGVDPRQLNDRVLNFLRFITWPDEVPGNALRVCLARGSVSDSGLAPLAGETIRSRRVVLVPEATQFHNCDAVLLGAGSTAESTNLLALSGKPILTIGWGESFCLRGGAICIEPDDRLPFSINLDAFARGGFKVNSRLLALHRMAQQRASASPP